MLVVKDLYKKYNTVEVLKGISLTINKGEMITIVGASGAGKSTLLQIIGTLDRPDQGQILIDKSDITNLKGDALARFRNENIGFVFQFHNLLPEFTAIENICLPGYISGTSKKEVEKRALDLMKLLKIDHRKDHKPSQMSGGEQQRAAVARALINQPAIIFADEPSGNLDSKNAEELHQLFVQLKTELQQTFVIVTHNKELAHISDRSIEIRDGKILEENLA